MRIWIGAGIVGVLLLVACSLTGGITVTIINAGPRTMEATMVHVKEDLKYFGDLPPGRAESRRLSPTRKSGLEIAFTDSHKRVRREGDVYLGSASRVHVVLEVRNGRIERTEHHEGMLHDLATNASLGLVVISFIATFILFVDLLFYKTMVGRWCLAGPDPQERSGEEPVHPCTTANI
jgi:hypothetical protein